MRNLRGPQAAFSEPDPPGIGPTDRRQATTERWALRAVLAQMYAMQSIELIRNFLHDRLGVEAEQVVADAGLADLGVDSLMLAELMFEAEDLWGITIDAGMLIPKTVGDMVKLLDGLLAAKASAS